MCGPNMGQVIAPGQTIWPMPQNAAIMAAHPQRGGLPVREGPAAIPTSLSATPVNRSASATGADASPTPATQRQLLGA